MKIWFPLVIAALMCFSAAPDDRIYVGSTPAHADVRDFLEIPLTDSVDFIRWKLRMRPGTYELECKYGLSKAGTPGFVNEQTVSLRGELKKDKNQYSLTHSLKKLFIVEVNTDLLHLLDQNKNMLVGNGGYSYSLNSTLPVQTDEFNIPAEKTLVKEPLVFEGRTPCQRLATLMGLNKTAACNKMKWYIVLYTDSTTRQPSYFLSGGMGYRKESMQRGKWKISNGKNGRIIYELTFPDRANSVHLLKGDKNILFFTDGEGRLLVGNEDFSYVLNRRAKEYLPLRR